MYRFVRSFLTTSSKLASCEKMIVTKVLCVAEKHDAAKNIAKFLSNGKMKTKKGGDKYIYNFSFNSKFVTSINIY